MSDDLGLIEVMKWSAALTEIHSTLDELRHIKAIFQSRLFDKHIFIILYLFILIVNPVHKCSNCICYHLLAFVWI